MRHFIYISKRDKNMVVVFSSSSLCAPSSHIIETRFNAMTTTTRTTTTTVKVLRFSRFRRRSKVVAEATTTTTKKKKKKEEEDHEEEREKKTFWIETTSKACVLAAMESGCSKTFVVEGEATRERFARFAPSDARFLHRDGARVMASFSSGDAIASIVTVREPEDVATARKQSGVVLVDVSANDWSIIPAENLVAASAERGGEVEFIACVKTSEEALEQLEALETGVRGVVLKTDDEKEVRLLAKVVQKIRNRGRANEKLETVKVTNVKNCGTGDRACVDCSTNFKVGEGLLVGNFANGLFLVHSECLSGEGYVNSRPFRVNAGAIHSYAQMPNGRTGYLSELKAGEVVLRVNAKGETEEATVGRVKTERRSMVLVEAEKDGETYSCLLQNAETVRLICNENGEAKSVSDLRKGDEVLIKISKQARHTGIAIDEDTWYER